MPSSNPGVPEDGIIRKFVILLAAVVASIQ